MRFTTYLIVPAWSDQAGQCRIVSTEHGPHERPDLKHCRANPSQWKDAGNHEQPGPAGVPGGAARALPGHAGQLPADGRHVLALR